jgi:DNA-binding transcriptional LysR family regulator
MDYSDRRVNLIEEGIDLSIRVTRQLASSDVARRLGGCVNRVVAAPDYLARHGCPHHPRELAHHAFLGYTLSNSMVSFDIDGQLLNVPVRPHLTANNGEVLAEAAAQGMGITSQPDFIVEDWLASGRLEVILRDFAMPPLGVYALLPGNKQIPHRVRVLLEFLAERMG